MCIAYRQSNLWICTVDKHHNFWPLTDPLSHRTDTMTLVLKNVWWWAPPRYQDGLNEWPSVTKWHGHGTHSLQRILGPSSFNPEYSSTMFLRNIGTSPPHRVKIHVVALWTTHNMWKYENLYYLKAFNDAQQLTLYYQRVRPGPKTFNNRRLLNFSA